MDTSKLKQGPIRNDTLADSLLQRVKVVHAIIGVAYPKTLEEFEIGFMSDHNPEKEVAVWEHIAAAFENVAKTMPNLDPKVILRTLLAYSMGALSKEERAKPDVKTIIEIAEKE